MNAPHHSSHDGRTYRLAGESIEELRAGERPRVLSADEARALPAAVTAAFGAFWQRLRAAPSVVVEADQWRSTYRTELDGWRYTWWEDRHDPAEGITAERILPAV
jgi:hypothetical protein